MQPEEITISDAAHRVGLGYQPAYDRVLRGDFGPARFAKGRWFVRVAGVEAYLARTATTCGEKPARA